MNWNPSKTGVPAIDDQLFALKNALDNAEKYLPTQALVRTNDATVTTLATIPVPLNQVVKVQGQVAAHRTGGSAGATNDGAGYTLDFVCTNTAGTAAIIGTASVTTIGESQAAWAVTVTFSGTNALVRVAGAANNNVTWIWSGQLLTVKE